MRGKRGFELSWNVLVPLVILVLLLVLYLIFSGVAAKSISNAFNFIKNLFRFG